MTGTHLNTEAADGAVQSIAKGDASDSILQLRDDQDLMRILALLGPLTVRQINMVEGLCGYMVVARRQQAINDLLQQFNATSASLDLAPRALLKAALEATKHNTALTNGQSAITRDS